MVREHEVQYPDKKRAPVQRRRSGPVEKHVPPPVKVLPDDQLRAFVVDHGASYGYPASREELDRANAEGKTERASSFFMQQQHRDKPFYGEIPTVICHWDGHSDRGVDRINQVHIRKDFKPMDVALDTPARPEAFIVAGGGVYGAQRSAYERSEPVAYSGESYWALVYAGSGPSSAPYVIDRVNIGEKETQITLYRPPIYAATCDIYPYWYLVPLGRLPDGPYSVKVQLANSGETQSSATATLRRATEKEQQARNDYWENEQVGGNKHYAKLKHLEELHAAGLQLRLERLAEFVHGLEVSESDREVLTADVEELGKAVDWDRNIYRSPNQQRRPLGAPTPGETVEIDFNDKRWDSNKATWGVSDIKLADIWMSDGSDAGWYASKTYRKVPEFAGALTADKPTPVQQKIREICKAIEQNHKPPSHQEFQVRSFPAAGTLESVLDEAHRVFVEGKPRPTEFSPDDDMWVVYIASGSFLIRQVDVRDFGDKISRTKHRGFRIYTSAYIAGADGVAEENLAPVTLALIPLGKPGDVDSVGVGFSCRSVCCRDVGDEADQLLDVKLPDLWFSGICGRQDSGAGFQVKRESESIE